MYGDFILVDEASQKPTKWSRVRLGVGDSRKEAWLRDTIFKHPDLLPVGDIDPAFGPLAPLCTEMQTGAGPVDAVFVNPAGRLTLVECKLWRNPQARREVVAQILDYARTLTRWSFSDLQRQVAARTDRTGNVPFAEARAIEPNLEESRFIDATTRCLKHGHFLLLIVGDGIREDIEAIAELINRNATSRFQLAIVEAALYSAGSDVIAVQPRVQEEYRAWWQPVLRMAFDDPDQTPPVLHWPNNVRARLPWPKTWITAYRAGTGGNARAGVFVSGDDSERQRFWDAIGPDAEAVASELLGARADRWPQDPSMCVWRPDSDFPDADAQREWIMEQLNAYVNALRPRMKRALENARA